ncbi:SDR family oxidoreductase [Solimonas sp. SE-A11]|uniref:SDR family oxidoreductase n=1 Tax=Solimonas sp. SE-A11 TaxID=3054954 RepID=UPI00259CB0B5|nr:SDR family oxidoreductase [Solimonas sp. SE-A11]MDM4769161.1 SDR family oxidoreductase [Solimonas sp. SE-A11]
MTQQTQTNLSNIAGKVVVITGASSGLGEATARHLAGLGAKVVLGARRAGHLERLVAEIRAAGGEAIATTTDVTDRDQVETLVARAIDQYGRIDVMVNNAGYMALAPMARLKVEEWDRMIDINIKGVLNGVAAALPRMQAQGSGHIINVASVAGTKVFSPIGAVYSATKFAVRAISEGLRAEVGSRIRTTVISPGAVASELKHGSSDAESAKAVGEWYSANEIPAESVARAMAFAISQPPEVDINEILLRPTAQEF